MFAGAMLVAMAVDAGLGWPAPLFARIGHPVVWIGHLIRWAERGFNAGSPRRRRDAGTATALGVTGLVMALGWGLQALLPGGLAGALLIGVLAWPLLATRALHDHVAAVVQPLALGDLAGARAAVAMIVGRDPARLDAPGVARAAIESLAENASDGIVAPLFWGLLLGLPGIAGYKAINTLDSMIGHRNSRYADFGWFAARLDDWVNLIPARLTGMAFAIVSGRARRALAVMMRDAAAHRSPNAGWPEAAMAGALDVRLSGPRAYGDRVAQEPWVNGDAPDPDAAAIERGLLVYARAMALVAALLFALAVL